jgi:tetratricopeptide (TPR) repeat protein
MTRAVSKTRTNTRCWSGRYSGKDLAAALNNRGNAYQVNGDIDRAIADYDEAIQLDPNLADAFTGRGPAYRNKGDVDRAIVDYDQAIRLSPNYAMAFNNRGGAYQDK